MLKIVFQKRFILFMLLISFTYACTKDDDNNNEKESLEFSAINSLFIDHNGTKWIGTDKGIVSYNNSEWKNHTVDISEGELNVNDMCFEKSNSDEIWLATTTKAIVFSYDVDAVSSATSYNTDDSKIIANKISAVTVDAEHTKYFGTAQGVSIFKGGSWFETIGEGDLFKTNTGSDLFTSFAITDIGTANNGYNYVTTMGGGIGRFMIENDAVTGATVFEEEWTSLATNNIYTVFVDDTTQWYGTEVGVAEHYSEYTKWDWNTYTTSDGLIDNKVFAITKGTDGTMWFGTEKGVSSFDGTNWNNYSVETHSLIDNKIIDIAVDIDESIWIATSIGLSNFKNDQWINYPNNLMY